MATGKKYDNSGDGFREPTRSEVFAKETPANPSARDVFAGDGNFYRGLGRQSFFRPGSLRSGNFTGISLIHVFLAINMFVVTALLCYIVFRSPIFAAAGQDAVLSNPPVTALPITSTPAPSEATGAQISKQAALADAGRAEQPLSWKTAEMLYCSGDYERAFHVFGRLADHLPVNGNEAFADYLQLMMALCIEQMSDERNSGPFLMAALQSRAPLVRALANYRLALVQSRNRQFLEVRKHAYRTIALIRAFENHLPQNFEADAYFTAAEALTRQILVLNNASDRLPGQLWTDSLQAEIFPPMEVSDLCALLQAGIAELAAGAAGPKVNKQEHLGIGMRWSAASLDVPLEELAARIASTAGVNLSWADADGVRMKPVTICISNASEQFVAEVAAGCAGAIARFDNETIAIHDPQCYSDLAEYKSLLNSEALAVWRRFTLRYRGDHRMANAHYALGLLLNYAGQTGAALGEYKLVAGRYPNNPLAPFALLNASIIKTNVRDYTGARQDLTELITQYPDCKVIDTASLYLADATVQAGLYTEATRMYKRVFNLDLSNHSRREAAYGLGRCHFETRQYEQAAEWFSTAIELTRPAADQRFRNASFMLGQCCIKLNRFTEASRALSDAIDDRASNEEFVKVMLELIRAETGRHNYVNALNILENIPQERLNQEESCAVLRAKAGIYVEIDLVQTAISLLRRKIEFIADSTLRAQLSLDLARCYAAANNPQLARKEVSEALLDLPEGLDRQKANLLLADVCLHLHQYDNAVDACVDLLSGQIDEETISQKAHEILGACYTHMKQYEKAALAYAGVHGAAKGGISPP